MATISLSTRHGRISAWKATPHVPPRGAVVVVQEIFGVNAHIRAVCDKFAAYGYIAVAPALFDFKAHGVELDYDDQGIARGRELAEAIGFEGALDGVRAAYDLFEGEYKVAAIGYCWGGSVAFYANCKIGLPAVSYYGGRTVPFLGHLRPKAPLLLHFGERDPLIPAEDVQKHRDALASAEIHVWPAGHGFNCDQRADYDAEVAHAAMGRTLAFLQKHLR